MPSDLPNHYKEFQERFKNLTDQELLDTYNKDLGNPGWVSARAVFLSTLQDEFKNRGIDLSDTYKKGWKLIKNKMKLVDKKVVIVDTKIPEGLFKCKTCGEYKGKVKPKNLKVKCLCDGILCSRCKKNKIHRPISNSYDPKTNEIFHHPWFTGWMVCSECNNTQQNPPIQNPDPEDYLLDKLIGGFKKHPNKNPQKSINVKKQ